MTYLLSIYFLLFSELGRKRNYHVKAYPRSGQRKSVVLDQSMSFFDNRLSLNDENESVALNFFTSIIYGLFRSENQIFWH